MNTLILHGRRLCELRKWPRLIVSVKLSQNPSSFSSATAAASDSPWKKVKTTFTVSYLVDSLGLPTKTAESISKKVSFEEKSNPDSVLGLLRSHSFTDSQISNIVTDYPRVLIADAEKSLSPKLKFLQSRGASSSELAQVISLVPTILGMKEEGSIISYYGFVKEMMEAEPESSNIETLCRSLPQGRKQENLIRNALVLRGIGVPPKRLFRLLITNNVLFGKQRFEESLKKVVEMGFDPSKADFVRALRGFNGLRDETFQQKIRDYTRLGLAVGDVWELFKKHPTSLGRSKEKILICIETFSGLGFTKDEFTMMVKRFPQCLGLSAETLKEKTVFVVEKMNWPLKAMTMFPQVLGYSLEKRIVPRCTVVKAVLSRGLIGSELPSLASVLAVTDQAFLNRFVLKHDDKKLEAELTAVFNRDRVSLSLIN